MIISFEVAQISTALLKKYRDYVAEFASTNNKQKVAVQRVIKTKLSSIPNASVGPGSAPNVSEFSVPESLVRDSFIKNFSSLKNLEDIETALDQSRRQIKKIVVEQPSLLQQFFSESNSTDITVISEGLVKHYRLNFDKSSFLSRDFGITWDPAQRVFNTKINPSKEKNIINTINSAVLEYNAKTIEEFEKGIMSLKKATSASLGSMTIDINYISNNGIPTSVASIFKDNKGFIAGRFISALDLTILIRREIQRRMRPQSFTSPARPSKMTSRTFQFRNSFNITMLDYRKGVMNYFYLPYYDENEDYGYEVSGLVENSIRYVLQQRLRRQLGLTREFNY